MSTHSRHHSPFVNHDQVRHSALNKSTSKMQYSFCKSSRFGSQTRLFTDPPYYQLPSNKHQRSTTFGIGNKLTFEDRRELPASNTYTLEDEFSKEKTKKRGFSFGVGEKTVPSFFRKSDAPGPGAYNPEERTSSLSALILGKVKDHTLDEKIKVPGPGEYEQGLLTREGRSISSRYLNPRLPTILKEERARVKKSDNPAPGAYDPVLTPKGNPLLSKRATKFNDSRKLAIYKINDYPGPGCYNLFSEFPRIIK